MDSWAELLTREAGRAHLVALRATGDPALAEEAVQEACLRLIRGRVPELAPEQLRAYLLKTVQRTAANLARSSAARRRREEVYDMQQERGIAMPPEAAASAETARAARVALAGLPAELRQAVSLCCEQSFTHREAAGILGVPEKTVTDWVNRGLQRLQQTLAAAGFAGCVPAALAGGLGALGVPPAPAGLAAAIDAMVKGGAVKASAGTIAAGAAKGGLIVKIGLGVAAAGLVAGAAFWAVGGRSEEKTSPPLATPKGDVAYTGRVLYADHFAFVRAAIAEGLGGPAKQAAKTLYAGFYTQDDAGNFFVGDTLGCQIHWIDKDGTDRIIAGDGTKGFRDGPGDQARFDFGAGGYGDTQMHCDPAGNIYVSDCMKARRLRKVTRKEDGTWWVTTVSGGGKASARKGEWVKATDLGNNGCAPRWGLSADGRYAYYCRYGIHKVDLLENKATLVAESEEIARDLGLRSCPNSWHTGGAQATADGAWFYWSTGFSVYRCNLATGKCENYAGGGVERAEVDGTGLRDCFFHTVSFAFSPDASVIYTGGGDEDALRRIHQGKVMHLMADGSWKQMSGNKGIWRLGGDIYLGRDGKLYTCRNREGLITRLNFGKE